MFGVHGYDPGNSGAKASGRVDRVLLLIKHFCVQRLCFFPGEYLFRSARLQAGAARHAARSGWGLRAGLSKSA